MKEQTDRPLALITGATKGIGLALTHHFAAAGFDAVIVARTAGDLTRLQSELQNRHPDQTVTTVAADLSTTEGVKQLIEAVRAAGRAPDVLLNNAGWYAPGGLLEEPPGRLDRMMRLNVYAAYDLVRAFAPAMAARGSGHIINICSIASQEAFADCGAYLISKHALLGLTRALRAELRGKGVMVTAILPGPTATASWDGDRPPPGGLMPPEAVAQAAWTAYRLGPAAQLEEVVLRPGLPVPFPTSDGHFA